ncbi:MAG TPA: hypothetical protein VN153_02175, partial [Tahibacter sp.]|nr:hypothetical protein [Tahibacter sp.]
MSDHGKTRRRGSMRQQSFVREREHAAPFRIAEIVEQPREAGIALFRAQAAIGEHLLARLRVSLQAQLPAGFLLIELGQT